MVSDGKKAVANAITAKGVSTSETATFATMANNISAIPQLDTSDANATAAQILSGYTAYVKGSKVSGSMTNRGAVTSSLNCGASYTIPAGYHNGSGKVTANSLASQTSATATAAQILSGYTAWANGSKLTGTATQGVDLSNPQCFFCTNGSNMRFTFNTMKGFILFVTSVQTTAISRYKIYISRDANNMSELANYNYYSSVTYYPNGNDYLGWGGRVFLSESGNVRMAVVAW